jgi:LytS/YehU family sensor histidine kinase
MGYLEVVIEDNGAGMTNENGQAKNDLSRKSFGMSITRNRLHLLSGKQEPNTVKCIPLYDTEGKVAGTQVVILIWLAEHYSPNN